MVAQSRRSNIQLIDVPVRKNRENGSVEIIEEVIQKKKFPRSRDYEALSLKVFSDYPAQRMQRATGRHFYIQNTTDKERVVHF